MKSGSFFWGSFLIFLGVFILLNNFDLLKADLSEVIDYWPILFVIWGVSLLNIPQIVKNILMSLLGVILSLFLITVFTSGFGFINGISDSVRNGEYSAEQCSQYIENDNKFKIGKLNFSGGAGSFKISNTESYLYYVSSSSGNCDVDLDYPADSLVILNYSAGDGPSVSGGTSRLNHLKLSNDLIWDIDVSAGAAKLNLDLEELTINTLNIDAGATTASINVGAKNLMTKVYINCGAATLKIQIPKDAEGSIQGDFALTKSKFEGFTKNSSGIYVTDNYYSNANKVDFYIDGALSKISVSRK